MTDTQFDQFSDLVLNRVGITLTRKDVELDLGPEMVMEFESEFDRILTTLKASSSTSAEWQRYLRCLCNPETYFFRERRQLEAIVDSLRKSRSRQWKIWSIPCAGGEEPYSLAMMLLSRGISDFHITGSDIRGDLLEKAQRGVYDSVPLLNPFRDMLAEYWHYFDGNGLDKTYRVCDTVKTLVKFTHANVLESRTVPLGQFDVILCRNLLIYFDEHSKRKALEQMWKKLAPNGYLCLGAGDSIYKHLVMLETVDDTVGNSIYRKRE